MSIPQRMIGLIFGLFLGVLGVVLIASDGSQFKAVAVLIALAFLISGIRRITYYFQLARFMLHGKVVLSSGAVRIVLGIFMVFFGSTSTTMFAQFVLLAWFLFEGIKSILAAIEYGMAGMWEWKTNLLWGIAIIGLAIYSLFALQSSEFIVNVFGLGLVATGVAQIARAFGRSAPMNLDL